MLSVDCQQFFSRRVSVYNVECWCFVATTLCGCAKSKWCWSWWVDKMSCHWHGTRYTRYTLKAARVQADKQLLAEIQQFKSDPAFDRSVALLQEKGSLSWLNAVPLAEHDLFFHKTGFRDCLVLRYAGKYLTYLNAVSAVMHSPRTTP